jgi:type 1 glutamine amidotransferase
VYLFSHFRPDATVLLRADKSSLDMLVPGARVPDIGLPLCWCFTEERGRVFYSALGHFPSSWENPLFLRHVAGGLEWVLQGIA